MSNYPAFRLHLPLGLAGSFIAMCVCSEGLAAQGISRFEEVRREAVAANRPVTTTRATCASAPASDARYKSVFTLWRWERVGATATVAFEIVEVRRDGSRIVDIRTSSIIDQERIVDILPLVSDSMQKELASHSTRTSVRLTLPGGQVVQFREGSKAMDLGEIHFLNNSRLDAVRSLLRKAVAVGGGAPCDN